MHIILTHEQADFDAIGSMLGAALLTDKAVPVLPRKMNRNVRSFLNIYQTELPFQEPRDLAPGAIEKVTLVDTQSLVTLKGVSKKTEIYVVDHHKSRTDLPSNWQVKIDRLGSCTTLFVENLRDQNNGLTSLQATLLLLGIYEDTGSLSYVNTTPRDVHAAAYLLEQGASLRIASQFLNPPLSAEQRGVYDKLLSAIKTLHINGQQIIISSTTATELTEEISSVAHKLRDLLDPDALILVIRTNEGIRLIARSTSDQIDVSSIMAQFNGGGHERAASALIQVNEGNPTLEQIADKLETMIPQFVRPSVTVGQIMSRKPLTLAPETTTQKADQLMLRFGFEGYPVVKEGKVIGLLTRRSVDRALSHKLNLPAESLMDSGEITVSLNDPLEQLQRVMASSGWGQIPVIDPASNKIIGIVTRTDLLKALGKGEITVPGHHNLASRLESNMPPARLGFLKLIADTAREAQYPIYIVGGFVRDLLLDRPGQDFDIVVEGDGIAFARLLESRHGGRIVTHGRFGTAKWQIADLRETIIQLLPGEENLNVADLPESLDLISARSEFYEFPTALPTVERSSIKLDLHRRDFTINTLALRLDGRHYGNLYDFWGGYNDLNNGIIRVLHSLSFVDDPTRMLRAVRFEQRFGFQLDNRTLQLMDEAKDLLKQLSGDRIRHELDLILMEQASQAILSRAQQLSLLASIHPALRWEDCHTAPLTKILHVEIPSLWRLSPETNGIPTKRLLAYLVWLGQIPLETLMEISVRMRFARALREALQKISQLLPDLPALINQKPSQVVARLEGISPAVLYAAYCLTQDPAVSDLLLTAQSLWLVTQPYTTGETLQKFGLPAGPAYKYLLSRLRDARLDGLIQTADQEQELLEQLISTIPADLLRFPSQ